MRLTRTLFRLSHNHWVGAERREKSSCVYSCDFLWGYNVLPSFAVTNKDYKQLQRTFADQSVDSLLLHCFSQFIWCTRCNENRKSENCRLYKQRSSIPYNRKRSWWWWWRWWWWWPLVSSSKLTMLEAPFFVDCRFQDTMNLKSRLHKAEVYKYGSLLMHFFHQKFKKHFRCFEINPSFSK